MRQNWKFSTIDRAAARVITFAFAFAMVCSAAPAQTTFDKPLAGPELEGPIGPTVQKEPNDADSSGENTASQATGKPADLAYGAYQRGYYLTALELALPRASSGDPAAQTLIAEIYWNGTGVAQDRKKAAEWYKFAASAGNTSAQFAWGNILLRGEVVKADIEKGRAALTAAAEAGHVRAAFNLAQVITASRPTWAGFKEAKPWYEQAAYGGLADAQYAMANILADAKGVVTNDEPGARLWLSKAAAGGLDTAQLDYAIWLANGRGGPKDETAALSWFQRAAAQNNVLAQNRLARMYAFGIGTGVDKIKSAAWQVVARRAGHNDPQLDARFADLAEIDQRRAIELANRLVRRVGN